MRRSNSKNWLSRLTFNEAIELSNIKTRQITTRLVKAAFSDPSSAMRLGVLYMNESPKGQVLNSLLSDKVSGAEKITIKDALRWQIVKDFEYGVVVNIDGWVVACTEARLSALTNYFEAYLAVDESSS